MTVCSLTCFEHFPIKMSFHFPNIQCPTPWVIQVLTCLLPFYIPISHMSFQNCPYPHSVVPTSQAGPALNFILPGFLSHVKINIPPPKQALCVCWEGDFPRELRCTCGFHLLLLMPFPAAEQDSALRTDAWSQQLVWDPVLWPFVETLLLSDFFLFSVPRIPKSVCNFSHYL